MLQCYFDILRVLPPPPRQVYSFDRLQSTKSVSDSEADILQEHPLKTIVYLPSLMEPAHEAAAKLEISTDPIPWTDDQDLRDELMLYLAFAVPGLDDQLLHYRSYTERDVENRILRNILYPALCMLRLLALGLTKMFTSEGGVGIRLRTLMEQPVYPELSTAESDKGVFPDFTLNTGEKNIPLDKAGKSKWKAEVAVTVEVKAPSVLHQQASDSIAPAGFLLSGHLSNEQAQRDCIFAPLTFMNNPADTSRPIKTRFFWPDRVSVDAKPTPAGAGKKSKSTLAGVRKESRILIQESRFVRFVP